MLRTVQLAALTIGIARAAVAGGFDCSKARTRIEKMICADRELAGLDEHLGRYFDAAKLALPGAEACLVADQRRWLSSVRDACRDIACLKGAYLNRLSELDPLQPGVTAIRHLTLPRTRSLVWIVPPALDRVAAPPNPNAKPFEATGTLVDELARDPNAEHGFVLRTPEGAVHPLVLLMFLEPGTADRLSSLAREQGVRFVARGHAVGGDKGPTSFDPGRCVFIYRDQVRSGF